jgi:hypothetical protein
MAQQTINVGASANDGTGSPLRTAFQFTNSNFSELYAALGGGTGLPGATNQVLFNNGTAIAGDAGMTYNPSTDTMSLVNLVLSGTFAARNGDTPSSIRAAASDYAAVAFDGATASTRISSTLTGQAIGTGDFSIWCRFKISQATAKAVFSVVEDANNYFGLTTSSGTYGLDKTIGGVASNATITGFTGAAFAGQIVDFVLVRSAGVFSVYVNGSAYTLTNTTGNISLSAVANLRVGGYFTASQVFDKRVYRSVVFNRALSATDVTELITTGVNPADQWGTQTAVYTSDFSVGVDSWGATAGTAAGNIDGIGGQNDNLRYTIGSGANNADGLSRNFTVIPSKRYRLNFSYYIPSGQTQINTLRAFVGLASVVTGLNVTNAWTDVSAEGVVTGDTSLRVNQNFVGTGNGTDVFYIRAVTATRIGAIVDLDFTVGAGYQATDRSTNNLHGTLFNGVEFTQPKRMAVLYATTNTNGNQQMLGATLAIPTNAIIEDIIVNSTGSATVSVGNASAGTQIVNGASVVSGRQKLTLATPFSTTGNLWVNSSSTATLQFTILYTIAA